jgi:hypothetical protein
MPRRCRFPTPLAQYLGELQPADDAQVAAVAHARLVVLPDGALEGGVVEAHRVQAAKAEGRGAGRGRGERSQSGRIRRVGGISSSQSRQPRTPPEAAARRETLKGTLI